MPCCSCHRTEAEQTYKIDEAAALMRVHPDTIRRAVHATDSTYLPAKKIGRGYRIAASELTAWWDRLEDA